LIAPLVHLSLTLIVLTILAFILIKDDEQFHSNVARYQHLRDKLIRALKYHTDTTRGRFSVLRRMVRGAVRADEMPVHVPRAHHRNWIPFREFGGIPRL
jgi:hypothetical protein